MENKIKLERCDALILKIKTMLSIADLLTCIGIDSLRNETMEYVGALLITLGQESLEIIESLPPLSLQKEEGKR